MSRLPALVVIVLALASTPGFAQSRLPGDVVPDHYDLTFTVDLANERFTGLETIRVRVNTPTSRVVLHALDLELEDVTIASSSARASAQPAQVALNDQTQTVTLTVARPLPRGSAQIRIRYRGRLNDRLRGFYSSKAGQRTYAATQFEATDARRAFPSFDEPALKATFALTLIVDRGDTAISNGRLLSDTPGPGPAQHTLKFSTSPKMSSYLVAIAVGDFRCLAGSQDAIPIRICATPDKVELGHIALAATRQILKFYNGYYAIKYPFGKLDIVALPDFAAGAMENTAAIFFRETALLAADGASTATRKNIADTIAHEIAHQWFGDLVTMQWWDDLWLNEGFATWMSSHPLAAWKPEWNIPVDDAAAAQRALNLDALRSTHADSRAGGYARRDRGVLRHHHLLEGRRRPAHDRALRRRRGVPERRQRLPAGACLRQRHVWGLLDRSRHCGAAAGRHDPADVRQSAGGAADRSGAAVREEQHRHPRVY